MCVKVILIIISEESSAGGNPPCYSRPGRGCPLRRREEAAGGAEDGDCMEAAEESPELIERGRRGETHTEKSP